MDSQEDCRNLPEGRSRQSFLMNQTKKRGRKHGMTKLSYLNKMIITAVCIALCVVLPMAFHAIPNAGSVISPMHIPALLCGLICGGAFGLLGGLLGPLAASFLTGMPPFAYLPPMMVELAVYGLVSGVVMQHIRTGRKMLDLYLSLLAAMLAGRIIAGICRAWIFAPGEYSFAIWASSYFVTAIPGIVLQLLLIPPVAAALERAGVIPGWKKNK